MLKSEPVDVNHIQIYDKKVITDIEQGRLALENNQETYIAQLKQIVFDEVIDRIENNLDMSATDILDCARKKMKNMGGNALITLAILKPFFVLFAFELYLGAQVNI